MIASHHEGKSGVGEGHRGSLICSIDEAQVVKNTHIQILISDPMIWFIRGSEFQWSGSLTEGVTTIPMPPAPLNYSS